MGVERHRGGRVAGRGTGTGLGPHHRGVAERRGHAVVLERPGGVQPLVLQEQALRLHPQMLGDGAILLEDRLALADGDLVLIRAEVQQLAEPPDAGEVQRLIPLGPALAERR